MLTKDREFLNQLHAWRNSFNHSRKMVELLRSLGAMEMVIPDHFNRSTEIGKENYEFLVKSAKEGRVDNLKFLIDQLYPVYELRKYSKLPKNENGLNV